jgi:hypothetical protein
MPRDFPDAPPQDAAASRPAAEDEDALDDAILLAELRFAIEGARTRAEDLHRRHDPHWNDRLDRLYARFAVTPLAPARRH